MVTGAGLIDYTEQNFRNGPRWETDRAQIIYKTSDGKDYCRETMPQTAGRDHDTAAAFARDYFNRTADATARLVVTGFIVEWW